MLKHLHNLARQNLLPQREPWVSVAVEGPVSETQRQPDDGTLILVLILTFLPLMWWGLPTWSAYSSEHSTECSHGMGGTSPGGIG